MSINSPFHLLKNEFKEGGIWVSIPQHNNSLLRKVKVTSISIVYLSLLTYCHSFLTFFEVFAELIWLWIFYFDKNELLY